MVGALLVLGRATSDSGSQDSSRPGLRGSHHLPLYVILFAFPRGPHPLGNLETKSHLDSRLGLLQLWGAITLCADLR